MLTAGARFIWNNAVAAVICEAGLLSPAFQTFGTLVGVQPSVPAIRSQCDLTPESSGSRRESQSPLTVHRASWPA